CGAGSGGGGAGRTLAGWGGGGRGARVGRAGGRGGDTALMGLGQGTIASRVAATAGPAVARSAREVARRARLAAGEMLECAPADVVLADGRAHVAGPPPRGRALRAPAARAPRRPARAPDGAPRPPPRPV